MYKCRHFDLEELVSEKVFRKYKQKAWTFFDPRALLILDWLRETLDRPITVNDWVWNPGGFHQRGFRANLDDIVKNYTDEGILYCSAHCRGMAFDLNVSGMKTKEVIQWLEKHKNGIPYNIRIELDDKERLHFDVVDMDEKIYYFKVA